MHQVPHRVNHDIRIVSVLNIKQVVVQGVTGEGFHEIFLCLFEEIPEIFLVESFQSPICNLSACLPGETLL